MEVSMSKVGSLGGRARLRVLREVDCFHHWNSLDDTLRCVLCERPISGREIRVVWNHRGQARLHCPTRGCRSTPREWVHPGNPLVSEEAWHDWERLLATAY